MKHEFDWQARGRCVGCDPDLFFPTRGIPTVAIKNLCHPCPVRLECLSYSLSVQDKLEGIWGGLGQLGRRKLRRTRCERCDSVISSQRLARQYLAGVETWQCERCWPSWNYERRDEHARERAAQAARRAKARWKPSYLQAS